MAITDAPYSASTGRCGEVACQLADHRPVAGQKLPAVRSHPDLQRIARIETRDNLMDRMLGVPVSSEPQEHVIRAQPAVTP